MTAKVLINASYFVVALLFILGLKAMSSPVTARRGIIGAGAGMVLATLVTFGWPGMSTYMLMITARAVGGGVSWWSGKTVRMTDMPQMVALYNGMGGGAAAAIAAIELARGESPGPAVAALAALGGLIGTVSFSGSLVAFAKLQGLMRKTFQLPAQNAVNLVLAALTLFAGAYIIIYNHASMLHILLFFVLALALGAVVTMPIGGADMPVVISLFNALTGLAVGFEGYVLNIPALIIAGIVVGSAGSLLTHLMARAMNRPLSNILFKPITGEARDGAEGIAGTMKEVSALDAASLLRYAQKVIIVPGYGMAVGQAQHKVEEINEEFGQTDVALVIGANDVVNPAARTEKASPIYGMPILNADQAHNVIVIKRGKGAGYSGIENALFYSDNTRMLYGGAQQVVSEVIRHIKELSS